jgi:methionyl-tRNA formyltransferase
VRTVYLGSSVFAVTVLAALVESPHRPVLAVAPPDRPKGRGRKVGPPPVARAARDLGIELYQTADVNDEESLERIAAARPEAVCVCEFGQLIKEPLLSSYLILNVHPSLLPRWRGAAPIERTIMAGDETTGVTIFAITRGLDSGPIALSRAEPVRPDDTAGTLAERLAPLGARLMVEVLESAEAGALDLEEQRDEGVTYAEKIDPAERHLDPARPAHELERIVRALAPAIGAYVEAGDGERLGVAAARAVDGPGTPGEVTVMEGELLVGCGEGRLELLEVTPPGKRAMAAADYLRGHPPPAHVR